MAWDLALDSNFDLVPGIVTGDDEIIQRCKLRLYRILGEWFLNTASGLPWYSDGHGILGAPNNKADMVTLLIRQCILDTAGVLRIMDLNTTFLLGTRDFTLTANLLLDSGLVSELSMTLTQPDTGLDTDTGA